MKVFWDDRFHLVCSKVFVEWFGKPYTAPRFPCSGGFTSPLDFECQVCLIVLMTFMISYSFDPELMIIPPSGIMRCKADIVLIKEVFVKARDVCVMYFACN